MQGAARMVMQTGMHPAAIKDSVTSKFFFSTSLISLQSNLVTALIFPAL